MGVFFILFFIITLCVVWVLVSVGGAGGEWVQTT